MKTYQKVLCGLGAVFGILIILSWIETAIDAGKEIKQIREEEPQKEASPAPEEEEAVFTPEQYRDFLQDELDAEVEYIAEDKTFTIFNDDPELAEEIARIYVGMLEPDSWNDFVETFVKTSNHTEDLLGESGYALFLCNPVDRDRYILGAMDGVLLYDYITGYNVDEEDTM